MSIYTEDLARERDQLRASLRELQRLREAMTMHAQWAHGGAVSGGMDAERCAAMERSMWDALKERPDGR